MERKTIAIIGASYLQLPLVLKAREMGIRTICFAWADGAVCSDYVDEFYPISIVEKEEILSICQAKKIDGVCTIASDVAAPTVAYVAEKMGLVGNSYEASVRANNKYLMREAFDRGGIQCPAYRRITSVEQLGGENLRFPLIVKPTDRSGSLGITKITKKEDLPDAVNKAIDFSFGHEAIVEEYVEGHEISVEFISYNGEHFPLQITDKVTTDEPHFVEIEQHQPAELSSEQYIQIYSLTAKALDVLGVTNGASHSEYKITKDGGIYVLEIGARMGGDFIGSDLVQLSTGYDYLKGVIEVALGKFEKPIFGQKRCAGVYFLCEETKHLMPVIIEAAKMPQVVRSEIMEAELHHVTCSADRSGYLIYQSDKRLIL